MSNMAKQKGKRGEREMAQLLSEIVGAAARRGGRELAPWEKVFADVQAHGGDIVSIPGLAIEVKRQETLRVPTWWKQACVQADEVGAIPVLVYRQNRKAWRACLPAYLLAIGVEGFIEMDMETFSSWLLHYLNSDVASG